jgi:hypothetical protein
MADLPIGSKVRSGPRWADCDLPVPPATGPIKRPSPLLKSWVKRAAGSKAAIVLPDPAEIPAWEMPALADCHLGSEDILARFIAFVVERDRIRLRRAAGLPREQWTDVPLLARNKFTNIRPLHDRVARDFQHNWMLPHRNAPDAWFLAVVHVLFNWPPTLAAIGLENLIPINAERALAAVEGLQAGGKRAFNSPAYSIKQTARQTIALLQGIWGQRAETAPREDDRCIDFANRLLRFPKIGTFLAAQMVLHLKPHFLRGAPDYEWFALPGPGSMRLMNRIDKLPLTKIWQPADWYLRFIGLHKGTLPRLAEAGIDIADYEAQCGQNCCCEGDKVERWRADPKARGKKFTPSAEPLAGEAPMPLEPSPAAAAAAPPPIEPAAGEPQAIPAHILADVAPAKAAAKLEPVGKPVGDGGGSRKPNGLGAYPPQGQRGTGGRSSGQRVDFYIYLDARGRHYLGVERTSTKQFPQYHWDGKQWQKGLPKGFLKIPYRLPELLEAPHDRWVVIAAGEKDAETAVRLGFVATTNPGGEGKGQWTPELGRWFGGLKRVAIMEDNDPTGHAHAAEVATALRDIVRDIRIVGFRELPPHGDLTDWIEADPRRGHAELKARIEAAPAATDYELIKASVVVRRAVQWWWPGHLARGELEILTGVPDIGKSQVHCSYIAHMTTGRDWPDKAKGPPARDVIMLTAEDNMAHTVCPRLAAAGADLERVLILNKIRKDNRDRMFLLQEDLDVLARILNSNPAVGLVTLDPITAYMGGKVDSHRATDVRNQLGPLKELAERCDVAFSAITHPAKKPGPKALDHYIGSQAFIAAPRLGHICIPEFEDGEDGKPKATGRYLFATPKHNIYFAMPTLAYRLATASGGVDAATGEAISISRVEWAEEVGITADQALAAAAPAARAKSAPGVVTFLLDILANGPVAKTVILERAAQRGFTEDQLRRAKAKAGIQAFKETGKKDGRWFWAMAEHLPADQQREGDD